MPPRSRKSLHSSPLPRPSLSISRGRIGLSDALLKHAGVGKDAVLSGGLSKFNVYSPERWAATVQKSSPATQADFMRRFGI